MRKKNLKNPFEGKNKKKTFSVSLQPTHITCEANVDSNIFYPKLEFTNRKGNTRIDLCSAISCRLDLKVINSPVSYSSRADARPRDRVADGRRSPDYREPPGKKVNRPSTRGYVDDDSWSGLPRVFMGLHLLRVDP